MNSGMTMPQNANPNYVTVLMSGGGTYYFAGTVGEFKTLVNSAQARGAAVLQVFQDTNLTQQIWINLCNVDAFF